MDRFIGKIRISHFFFGTFLPARRALESPITMACFLLVTFLQLLPLLNLPSFLLKSQFRHFSRLTSNVCVSIISVQRLESGACDADMMFHRCNAAQIGLCGGRFLDERPIDSKLFAVPS
jgi:hypothetical protein